GAQLLLDGADHLRPPAPLGPGQGAEVLVDDELVGVLGGGKGAGDLQLRPRPLEDVGDAVEVVERGPQQPPRLGELAAPPATPPPGRPGRPGPSARPGSRAPGASRPAAGWSGAGSRRAWASAPSLFAASLEPMPASTHSAERIQWRRAAPRRPADASRS